MVNAFETRASKLYGSGVHRQKTGLRRASWKDTHKHIVKMFWRRTAPLFEMQFVVFWTVNASTCFCWKNTFEKPIYLNQKIYNLLWWVCVCVCVCVYNLYIIRGVKEEDDCSKKCWGWMLFHIYDHYFQKADQRESQSSRNYYWVHFIETCNKTIIYFLNTVFVMICQNHTNTNHPKKNKRK